ncbi:MAG: hypothetical protein M3R61_01220 [Chloroflexota bacterium]|nr:hypothetical protein [Chloroflexota bacterium]
MQMLRPYGCRDGTRVGHRARAGVARAERGTRACRPRIIVGEYAVMTMVIVS